MKKIFRIFLSLTIIIAVLAVIAPISSASSSEPQPLYGTYNMYLDRSKQTLNGHSVHTNQTWKQTEIFTTFCDTKGCVAHSINKRPPPNFFDYQWVNGHWESIAGQQRQYIICNDGSKVNSIKFDVIKPNGDGSFSGKRTITVRGAGCPGEGPGEYRLPFTLTPIKKR